MGDHVHLDASHAGRSTNASSDKDDDRNSRRVVLVTAPLSVMGTGLAASYGAFGTLAGRFLYPA